MKRLMLVILVSSLLMSFSFMIVGKQENLLCLCDFHPIVAQQLEENSQAHQCRLWGMIANSLPEDVVLNHLVNLQYSLKNLGATNNNGWGLAYYKNVEPVVLRGKPPANADPNFDLAAHQLAESGARIGVGHVRIAVSGASNISNPHPFIRYKGGKWWAFAHNGVLSKAILKNLIGDEYLSENPPTVGDSWNDPDVVDSDLYMLYALKCIEERDWNVTRGIAKTVIDISHLDSGAMNFFLTDGESLWGFRKGSTLYYYYNATSSQYSAVASQPPTSTQDGWIALHDYNLATLTIGNPPSIIDDITTVPEFPSSIILSLYIVTTLLAIIVHKRKQSR